MLRDLVDLRRVGDVDPDVFGDIVAKFVALLVDILFQFQKHRSHQAFQQRTVFFGQKKMIDFAEGIFIVVGVVNAVALIEPQGSEPFVVKVQVIKFDRVFADAEASVLYVGRKEDQVAFSERVVPGAFAQISRPFGDENHLVGIDGHKRVPPGVAFRKIPHVGKSQFNTVV